jgi:hypothetical protein
MRIFHLKKAVRQEERDNEEKKCVSQATPSHPSLPKRKSDSSPASMTGAFSLGFL